MNTEFEENKISIALLIIELSNDNPRVFDSIFKEYYPNLCRFAFTIVHDKDMAQSLVQDIFVKFWENRKTLGHIENLASYLIVMVRNHCLNYLKREKRMVMVAQMPSDIKSENVTEKHLEALEFEEKLLIGLSSLPERCKLGFEYSRFENLNNKEIAQKMGITVKGVEALIGRALKSLRISLLEFLPSTKADKEA